MGNSGDNSFSPYFSLDNDEKKLPPGSGDPGKTPSHPPGVHPAPTESQSSGSTPDSAAHLRASAMRAMRRLTVVPNAPTWGAVEVPYLYFNHS